MRQSVLENLPTFTWNSDQSVAYEVAIEAISQAVAAYTAAIQKARSRGDLALAARLADERQRCTMERNQLRSTDHARVEQVTRHYRQLVDQLRAQPS